MYAFRRFPSANRWGDWPHRLAAGIALLSLTGCPWCGKFDPDPIRLPQRGDLELIIVPETTYVAAGVSFRLQVRVRTKDKKNWVNNLPAVHWKSASSRLTVQEVSETGLEAVLRAPSGPPPAGGGTYEGDLEVITSVRVELGGFESPLATVIVSHAGTGISTRDHILLPHSEEEYPVSVLMNVRVDQTNRLDHHVALAGRADFQSDLGPPLPPLPWDSRIVSFFPDRAFRLEQNPAVWKLGSAEGYAPNPNALEPRTKLKIDFWTNVGDRRTQVSSAVKKDLLDDLHAAQLAFDRSGAGIDLSLPDSISDLSVTGWAAGQQGNRAVSYDGDCNRVADVEGVLDLFGIDPLSPVAIHVAYVKDITGAEGGVACLLFLEDPFKARSALILVDAGNHDTMTLAHELGHVLGLNEEGDVENGHVAENWGFDCTNLMIPKISDVGCVLPRREFTLGQTFRMNFLKEASWVFLEHPDYPGGECPPSLFSKTPCPAMNLDRVSW